MLETGTLSNWLARGLRRRGLPVEVIDARRAHAVMRLQHNKTDANDAELLAELARTGFYRPVAVKSELAQMARVLLKARAHLVGQWKDRQIVIRGLLGGFGIRIAKGTGKVVARVRAVLAERPELACFLVPPGGLNGVDELIVMKRDIECLTLQIERHAKRDPICRRLMTAPGVGPITALAFAATIDDPGRFASSRAHLVGQWRLSGPHRAAPPVGRDGL